MEKHTFPVIILASATCFILGAFYQHLDILKQIIELTINDPYAYYIRHKLYSLLRLFNADPKYLSTKKMRESRLHEIMKYGFPGLDDLRLYSDFVLSYDRRNRIAHWVYEHLKVSSITENINVSRQHIRFKPDMGIPLEFRAGLVDYRHSGFDRGHLAAAANHVFSQKHCNETFFLTNVAPQVGKGFNRNAWNKLEIYIRDLTRRFGSVYVCTGPLYFPKAQPNGKYSVEYEVIGLNTVAVPTHFFKVITIESKLPKGKPYMEAYLMPNEPISETVNLRDFLCDISQIERAAGLQFFGSNGSKRDFFFGSNFNSSSKIYNNFK